MRKNVLSFVIFALSFLCFVGCDRAVEPTNWLDVKRVSIQVESENEIMVESFNVYLTNSHGDGTTLILASESGPNEFGNVQKITTENEFEHLVECDTGQVRVQFEIYLKVKYNGSEIPYSMSFCEDYYTKVSNGVIELFIDKKCEEKADFNRAVKDIKYNTGEVYNDNYKIDLKIYC